MVRASGVVSVVLGLAVGATGYLMAGYCTYPFPDACYPTYGGIGLVLMVIGSLVFDLGVLLIVFPEYPTIPHRGPLERLSRALFPGWFAERSTARHPPQGLPAILKFCPECGARLGGDEPFCPKDGHALKAIR